MLPPTPFRRTSPATPSCRSTAGRRAGTATMPRPALCTESDEEAILVHFQPGGPHDLEPLRAFLGQQRSEILRRAAERVAAKLLERGLHVIGGERLVDRP